MDVRLPMHHEAKGRDAAVLRGFRCWQGSPGCVPLPAGWQEVPRRGEAALMAGECGCMRAGRAEPCPCSGGLFLLAASSGSCASGSRPGGRIPREAAEVEHLVGVLISHLAPP